MINCKNCNKEIDNPRQNQIWCCDNCRKKYGRAYNASSIKIHNEEFDQIMDWKLADDLSQEYIKPVEWIKRSIKACREAGESPQYFIDRYLDKKDIPKNLEVEKQSLIIQRGML